MKKINLVGIILAVLSFISFIFLSFNEDGTDSIVIMGLLGTLVSICFALFHIFNKKVHCVLWVIPLILIMFISSFFNQLITEVANAVVGNSSTTSSYETFSLILVAFYVTSIVLFLLKNMKWTAIVGIVFAAIMILDSFSAVLILTELYQIDYLIFGMISIILLGVAEILLFAEPLLGKKDKKVEVIEEVKETLE